jgi:hypothetical protein
VPRRQPCLHVPWTSASWSMMMRRVTSAPCIIAPTFRSKNEIKTLKGLNVNIFQKSAKK